MLIHRVGLCAIFLYCLYDTAKDVRGPEASTWRLHGLARLPGVTRLAPRVPSLALAAMAAVAAILFAFDIAPLASSLAMATGFILLASLFHSLPWNGYSVEGDDGKTKRQIYHHLHLPGLCALAAVASEVVAVATRFPRDEAFLELEWAAIGAHYFVAGVSKVKRRGFGWVDRRLFPYYIALLKSCARGDTGQERELPIAKAILKTPSLGLAMLWTALLCELGSIGFVLGPWPRLAVGLGLIGFHFMSSRVLYITFNENLFVLLLFVFAGFQAPAEPLLGVAALAVFVLASFAAGERLFPFSVLPMFTSPYTPQRVLLVTAPDGRTLPMPQLLGGTTSGVSRELSMHLAEGRPANAFLDALEPRIRDFTQGGFPARYRAVVRTIAVDPRGSVTIDEAIFERGQTREPVRQACKL